MYVSFTFRCECVIRQVVCLVQAAEIMAYRHMQQKELELMRRWHTEEGMSPHVIAVLLGCSPRTFHRRLAKAPGRVGHPRMRTEAIAAMVRRRAGLSYCECTIRDAFRAHGKPFKKLSEKPLLTPEDVKARLAFAEKYHARPKRSWLSCPHAIIDNKKFPMYVDHRDRVYAARRSVRGAYRSGADAVQSHLVKPKDTMTHPPVCHRWELLHGPPAAHCP
jgi:hypothetical protein